MFKTNMLRKTFLEGIIDYKFICFIYFYVVLILILELRHLVQFCFYL